MVQLDLPQCPHFNGRLDTPLYPKATRRKWFVLPHREQHRVIPPIDWRLFSPDTTEEGREAMSTRDGKKT